MTVCTVLKVPLEKAAPPPCPFDVPAPLDVLEAKDVLEDSQLW